MALACVCSPSVNESYKASIDQRVAALTSTGQHVDVPSSRDPMPLAVGQWSRYKVVDDQGQPGFISYDVVGQRGDAFCSSSCRRATRGAWPPSCSSNLGDRMDPSMIEVKALKQKADDGSVNEFPAPVLGLMKSMWGPLTEALVINWQDKAKEAAEARRQLRHLLQGPG